MNKHTLGMLGLSVSLLCASTAANAALVTRLGGQAVYDTDRNITWLADANLAATNTFGVANIQWNGTMGYVEANDRIAGMNAANYLGFNDWRLPNVLQPDPTCSAQITAGSVAYNCTGGELGHLYYEELGGVADQPLGATHNANFNLFQNIEGNYIYAQATSNSFWNFYLNTQNYSGYQTLNALGSSGMRALAVRDGDVAVSSVPLPSALWLFCSGVVGLITIAKRTSEVSSSSWSE